MATTDHARLRLLGHFELWVDGQARDVPWQAQRVLAFLALGPATQPRSTVAGSLWGEMREQRALASLRNALWRIRQLGPAVLRCSRNAVGLAPGVALDLRDAQRAAHAVLHDAVADTPTTDMLDRDLLPSWDEPWLLIERERQRQLRLHALERLSATLVAAGRHAAAIAAALAAVRAEPLRESAHRALVAAHLAEGNVSEAIRHFGWYRRTLLAELQIAPGEELESLVAAAVQQRAPHGRGRRATGNERGTATVTRR